MSITQDLAAVVTAANNLTQEVTDKITSIDQRVNQFQTDANNIVSTATSQLKRAKIGQGQAPVTTLTITPTDDAGALVKDAYANGAKHVRVIWESDGQYRHWNTLVQVPIGATLLIEGPAASVGVRGGVVRTGRYSYTQGSTGGTSSLGSPMVFRNLEPLNSTYPSSDYLKCWDEGTLIQLDGNNTLVFGDGTYIHDQGGITASAYGNGLIRVFQYAHDLPSYIGGGGIYCQFYLSGPLVNHCGGSSTCNIHFMRGHIARLTSDGPALEADKGYKRLLDRGVAGVTSDLLNKQPYEITEAEAIYNDSAHPGTSWAWFSRTRGVDTDSGYPRLIGTTTWAMPTGWALAQFNTGIHEVAETGIATIPGSNVQVIGA